MGGKKITNNRNIRVHQSRTPEQRGIMERIEKDGGCPFCRDFCEGREPEYHTKPILRETDHWVFTENFHPYEGTFHHWVIILKRHAESISELAVDEWRDVVRLVSWAEKKFSLPGAALFMRFGDPDYTVSSVAHLHLQLISGASREESDGEKILVGLGYKETA